MRFSARLSVRWSLYGLLIAAGAHGQEPEALRTTPLAAAFGSAPAMHAPRLSPDGNRISFVQTLPDGHPLVNVFDTRSGGVTTVLAGQRDGYDIRWCRWANDERLLCSLRFIEPRNGVMASRSRLASVNDDGSEALLLLQQDRSLSTTQYQDRIVDWIPDDPEHVLLALRVDPGATVNGTIVGSARSAPLSGPRVVRLNVYDSQAVPVESLRDDAVDWISDGHGTLRLFLAVSRTHRTWHVRESEDGAWSVLHQRALSDLDDEFAPVAFDRDANEVLFFDSYEGRTALYALELDDDRTRRLVYSHPRVDVAGVYRVGRRDRVVAAVAIEDRPTLHFFEPGIQRVHDRLVAEFPGMTIDVIDEDHAERRYLVFVTSDRDPGTYYMYDAESVELRRLARAYPALGDRELEVMQPITYPAADGTEIPAYLMLPPDGASGAAVVLPHGGPSSRDYWRFDFLAQFLAARGYAVLQSNYRGSAGYGDEWSGEGGFQSWRQAVDDIADGARYLVEADIAEPGRLCVAGWSYGGYAALLSAIEHEPLFRCVVSIAGVTDPASLARNAGAFIGGRGAQAFIGSDSDVRQDGSPLQRADEIHLPTLLFHPHKDANVPFEQSLELRDAMRREQADVELVEYAQAEHDIGPPPYRIDMLVRLGDFLDAHLGASLPDFYSIAGNGTDAPADSDVAPSVEIIDFGTDRLRPSDGVCTDARFIAPNGGGLEGSGGRVHGTLNDATDCRRLFASGDIVLRASVGTNLAEHLPATVRSTIFVDLEQQTDVGIVSFDGDSLEGRSGVSVVFARPGYHVVGVRTTGSDYACAVRVADGVATGEDVAYAKQRVGPDAQASLVSIPAFAGHYYRIETEIVDGLLLLRVTDVTENRIIVDQGTLVAGGCN